MKSSFSWPGRPPAEMISRNVKRLLTSILDGTLKRGAFGTSTLDGRLKRDAFLCTRVGAYCIRPTKRSRKGTRSAKGDQTHDSLSPTGPFGGAYLGTPYHATSKRGAFCTSYLVATLKRGAFCTSYLVATPKRGAFCTSYLVATPKRGAFCTSYLVATLKRGAFCTSTLDGTLKRGAFCTSTLDGTLKRGTFCASTLDGRLKRDAFLCTRVGAYCIRLTKRSRKGTRSVKGDQTHDSLSSTGPFGGAYAIRPYHATSKRDAFLCTRVGAYCIRPTKRSRKGMGSAKGDQTCDFLSPTGPFGGAYAIRPYNGTSKSGAFASSFSIVVFSSSIFLCLSSLFSSGRSSSRCSVMCAP